MTRAGILASGLVLAVLGSAPAAAAHEEEGDDDVRSSPLVRKLAREHNVDLSRVQGTGAAGRT